ncbi:MAG: hemolysin family protein [Planctomycetota bacterium]
MTVALVMLAVLPVLLVASAFMSGSETALFSLSQQQRAALTRGDGVVAVSVRTLLAETRGLLITLLLSNMVVNVLYFTIGAFALIRLAGALELPGWAAGAGNLGVLAGVILFGELMPKLVAGRMPKRWAQVAAVPLLAVHRLLTPVRVASNAVVITPLARLIDPGTRPPDLSAEELEALLSMSRRQGVIDGNEQRLLEQVLDLSGMRVRDLMVPRVDIEAYGLDAPPSELIETVRRTRLRRVPVYDGSLDTVVGVVTSRRVLIERPADAEAVRRLCAPVRFVPEQQRAERLMVELSKGGEPMAVVVDEHGGTAGLITIEDVVEHVVGGLAGGYERDTDAGFERLGAGRYRIDGDLAVADWPQLFGRPGASGTPGGRRLAGAVSTVSGLVTALLGRVPVVGDRVTVGNLALRVEAMDGLRIATVIGELPSDAPAGGDGARAGEVAG